MQYFSEQVTVRDYEPLDIKPDRLPVQLQFVMPRFFIGFFSVFGAFWTFVSLTLLIPPLRDGTWRGEMPEFLIAPAFTLIGLGILGLCLHLMTSSKQILLAATHVEIRRRTLMGAKVHRIMVSDYEGVLLHEELQERKNRADEYWQYVTLKHKDRAMDVPLVRLAGQTPPRDQWKAWAKRLGVAALQVDGAGYLKLKLDEVDQSLRERTKRHGFSWQQTRPPKGLVLWKDPDGEEMVVRILFNRMNLMAKAMFGFVPSIFLALPIMDQKVPIIFPLMGGLFMLFILGFMIADMRNKRELRLTRHRITITDKLPQNRRADSVKELALADVETILFNKLEHGHRTVQITGKSGTLDIGPGLSAEANRWLQDFLRASIATA